MRDNIIRVADTTDSMYAFRRTPDAALAPSNLDDIEVPVAYVWSTDGPVDEDTVERIKEGLGDLTVVESSTFQAHFEDHAAVTSALDSVESGS